MSSNSKDPAQALQLRIESHQRLSQLLAEATGLLKSSIDPEATRTLLKAVDAVAGSNSKVSRDFERLSDASSEAERVDLKRAVDALKVLEQVQQNALYRLAKVGGRFCEATRKSDASSNLDLH